MWFTTKTSELFILSFSLSFSLSLAQHYISWISIRISIYAAKNNLHAERKWMKGRKWKRKNGKRGLVRMYSSETAELTHNNLYCPLSVLVGNYSYIFYCSSNPMLIITSLPYTSVYEKLRDEWKLSWWSASFYSANSISFR